MQVELGGALKSVVTVTRWWTSKKAMAKFGMCWLKQEIKVPDIFLWILPMGADVTTNQRFKPRMWLNHLSAQYLTPPPTPSQIFFLPIPLLPSYCNLSFSSCPHWPWLIPSHLDSNLSRYIPHMTSKLTFYKTHSQKMVSPYLELFMGPWLPMGYYSNVIRWHMRFPGFELCVCVYFFIFIFCHHFPVIVCSSNSWPSVDSL